MCVCVPMGLGPIWTQDYKLVQPLWKTIWRFFRKTKIELSYKPAIALLDIYPDQTIILKDTYTPIFIATVHNSQNTETA